MSHKNIIIELKTIIKEQKLKYTKQRELVLLTILDSNDHISAEEILNNIRDIDSTISISIATVYRSLTFLAENKFISSITVGDDGKRYEANNKKHHDHLVCVKCNTIIEFFNEKLEEKQEEIAKENGFTLLNHVMYLYGLCKNCRG